MFKETYFTEANIREKCGRMREELSQNGHCPEFHPEATALLVLDMQEYFFSPDSHAYVPSAHPIVSRVAALADAFRAVRRPVIFTRHVNTDADAGSMKRWWRDLICKDDPLSRLIAPFRDRRIEVIEKSQYDAFYRSSLLRRLSRRQVKQVVITGVMTHLCCESTARAAFVNGFDVFFAIDGTATYTEAFHRATLLNLSHGFAVPMMTEELTAAMVKK